MTNFEVLSALCCGTAGETHTRINNIICVDVKIGIIIRQLTVKYIGSKTMTCMCTDPLDLETP